MISFSSFNKQDQVSIFSHASFIFLATPFPVQFIKNCPFQSCHNRHTCHCYVIWFHNGASKHLDVVIMKTVQFCFMSHRQAKCGFQKNFDFYSLAPLKIVPHLQNCGAPPWEFHSHWNKINIIQTYLIDTVYEPGVRPGRSRKLPSLPFCISRLSATWRVAFGWNHLHAIETLHSTSPSQRWASSYTE